MKGYKRNTPFIKSKAEYLKKLIGSFLNAAKIPKSDAISQEIVEFKTVFVLKKYNFIAEPTFVTIKKFIENCDTY